MQISQTNGVLTFDLLKINFNEESGQKLIKLSKKLQQSGKLEDKDVVWLGDAVDAIRVKGRLDNAISFLSKINTSARQNYLKGRLTEYDRFIRSSSGYAALEALEKKITCFRRMQSALHLDVIPDDQINDSNIKELYHEKRSFMNKQVDLSKIPQILSQNARYPAVQKVVNNLISLYEKWDDHVSNPEKMNETKEKLISLHKKLETLSDILIGFKSLDRALIHLNPQFFQKYIETSKILDKNAVNELKEALRIELETIQKETPDPLTPADLQARRKSAPVTTDATEMQARLFESSRRGSAWAAEQQNIKELGESVNSVYKLEDPTAAGETVAFYKEGAKGEQATGVMEELMWQIAVRLGFEKMFTPTKQAHLRTRSAPGTNAERERVFSFKDQDLVQKNDLSKIRRGGIQAALKGKALNSSSQISQEQSIYGTLSTLIFGMFDAHTKNILVDDQNNLHFFDNTRSMPHSNSAILYGNLLIPAFRSGLFVLETTYNQFSEEERDLIQKQITGVQDRIDSLEQYLKSPLITKRLSKLPKGWFNVDEAMNALKERVNNLDNAIKNPNVQNLRDLIFATIPDLKFIGLLTLAIESKGHPDLSFHALEIEHLQAIGEYSLFSLMQTAVERGINPQAVQDVSQKDYMTFEEQFWDIHRGLGISRSLREIDQFTENGARIRSEYLLKSKIEFKDICREEIGRKSYTAMCVILRGLDYRIYDPDHAQDQANVLKLIQTPIPGHTFFGIHNDTGKPEEPRLIAGYIDYNSGLHEEVNLDYKSSPGLLKFKLKPDGDEITAAPQDIARILADHFENVS